MATKLDRVKQLEIELAKAKDEAKSEIRQKYLDAKKIYEDAKIEYDALFAVKTPIEKKPRKAKDPNAAKTESVNHLKIEEITSLMEGLNQGITDIKTLAEQYLQGRRSTIVKRVVKVWSLASSLQKANPSEFYQAYIDFKPEPKLKN